MACRTLTVTQDGGNVSVRLSTMAETTNNELKQSFSLAGETLTITNIRFVGSVKCV